MSKKDWKTLDRRMKTYYLIGGEDAREEGFYRGPQFILEQEEEKYDNGVWLIPRDGDYAKWFCRMEALIDFASESYAEFLEVGKQV